MNKRYQWVDLLKGIAICAIVATHYSAEDLPSILGDILEESIKMVCNYL